MSETRRPIVVIGSINMDLVTRAPRIARAGETLIGADFSTTAGGKGANQAVAVARLGYPVHMLGMVGSDVFGQSLLENLASAGVNTDAVARVPGPSGVATILVADSGENNIVIVPGANAKLDPEAIDTYAALIRSAGMVLCQLEIPMPALLQALRVCDRAGVPAMLDPAPAANLPDEIWGRVAWFTPNETEAAFYVGSISASKDSAKHLLARGARGVVLKRGAEGAYIAVGSDDDKWVRSFPVEVVDTVAAGDCFNGAFAVALLEGRDPWSAARFAAAAAAISVTRRGAQASMPSRSDVDAFLAKHA